MVVLRPLLRQRRSGEKLSLDFEGEEVVLAEVFRCNADGCDLHVELSIANNRPLSVVLIDPDSVFHIERFKTATWEEVHLVR